jgi:diadenosine tetraphosphate (Ap4A) HIT family hydrolase
MGLHHYRKTIKQYKKHNANDEISTECTFCKELHGSKVTMQNETMFIIPNRVAYDMFEGLPVIEHLMLMPKRHTESLADFTQQETRDYMNIIGEHEKNGYSVYSRGSDNINRSVRHQHTHLMKLGYKKSRFILFAAKPYVLINR